MTVDITPIVTLFANLLLFLVGVDFAWCGYWYMKAHDTKRLPRMLGYLALKLFETGNRKRKSKNEFANHMFSMDAAGKYMLIGGILTIIGAIFSLLP